RGAVPVVAYRSADRRGAVAAASAPQPAAETVRRAVRAGHGAVFRQPVSDDTGRMAGGNDHAHGRRLLSCRMAVVRHGCLGLPAAGELVRKAGFTLSLPTDSPLIELYHADQIEWRSPSSRFLHQPGRTGRAAGIDRQATGHRAESGYRAA